MMDKRLRLRALFMSLLWETLEGKISEVAGNADVPQGDKVQSACGTP